MRGTSLRASLPIDCVELRISLARFAQDAKLAKERYFQRLAVYKRLSRTVAILIRPLRSLPADQYDSRNPVERLCIRPAGAPDA